MSNNPTPKHCAFATRVIHAGQSPDPSTGAIMPPIYATSTYVQKSPGVHKGFDYGRTHNPTRFALERCVADLEGGAQGFAFASGLAAIATVLELLDAGAHIIAGDDLYGGTFRLFERVRKRSAGHRFSFVDLTDPAAARPRFGPDTTKLVWVETPTNPMLQAGRPARDRGALPRARHPDRGGRQHLREPVGAAAARARLRHRRALHDQVPERPLRRHRRHRDRRAATRGWRRCASASAFLQNAVGAIAGPFDSFLALRGVKTLALRMERHCANALDLAQWLEAAAASRAVIYPGLESHPQHALAQAPDARLRRHDLARPATDLAGARRFLERCRSSRWPRAWAASRA